MKDGDWAVGAISDLQENQLVKTDAAVFFNFLFLLHPFLSLSFFFLFSPFLPYSLFHMFSLLLPSVILFLLLSSSTSIFFFLHFHPSGLLLRTSSESCGRTISVVDSIVFLFTVVCGGVAVFFSIFWVVKQSHSRTFKFTNDTTAGGKQLGSRKFISRRLTVLLFSKTAARLHLWFSPVI